MMRRLTKLFVATGSILLVACETHAALAPAVLETADDETIMALKAVLADAVGRATVELGAGDPTIDSVISVLPPPPGPGEDRSLATPTIFDLVLIDGACVVMERETGAQYPLEGIACRPL